MMTASFWYGIFWPYFQFLIFIALLIYFARKPVINFLESNRDDFRTRLSEAQQALSIAEQKVQKYEGLMNSLAKDIETIKERYLKEADLEKEKILHEANAAAESLLVDARRAANELITQSQKDLKEEIYRLALAEFKKQLTPERIEKIDTQFKNELIQSVPHSLS